MRILIAEDEPISRHLLTSTLEKWGHQVAVAGDGAEAQTILDSEDGPFLAILDVMMPSIGGIELCHAIRSRHYQVAPYLILLTSKGSKSDVVRGLEAGANDYVIKPFDQAELRARVNVGLQLLETQINLADRILEVENALAHVRQLQGILPICSYCKNIRDDTNYWQCVESYVAEHTDAQFSHGICPQCYETVVVPQIEELRRNSDTKL